MTKFIALAIILASIVHGINSIDLDALGSTLPMNANTAGQLEALDAEGF